ncbi:hypothetical protein DI005_13555 [Prauserella sp. PE36]|uniref:hypothetical protein n=1 Tax=Prauserella sp. PE36 TaxID=1504709 RepID=UPI000DE2FA16|nr:hypothetical protein [Prauserella sp. PE36]RBM20165.1 hypothetical protein DI005_13555 [Prauserella sp. PE36]
MDTATALTDPERQFVGCLLWLPHEPARRVLAGMRPDDLADPMAAHVLHLVIEVVAAGQAPAPVTVYAHATTTGQAPGEHRRHRLGRWLADTYGATGPAPADLAHHLKAVVLEAAWRRALAEHAHRLLHAVEASPTDLLAELADDTEHPDELHARYTAARTNTHPTRLEVAA